MTNSPNNAIPVAWLRPISPDYKIPLWRWLLLPASALMLKRNRGVWVSGALQLTETGLVFAQAKGLGLSKTPPAAWTIPFEEITAISVSKGMASDTLLLTYKDQPVKIMTVRADSFIAQLRTAVRL
jgi:hypothetical protein